MRQHLLWKSAVELSEYDFDNLTIDPPIMKMYHGKDRPSNYSGRFDPEPFRYQKLMGYLTGHLKSQSVAGREAGCERALRWMQTVVVCLEMNHLLKT